MDVHTKLMRKYKQVPEWWFMCILFVNIGATIFTCEYYNNQLQLPWWGILVACGLAIFFTLPVGIITATTNQVRVHANLLILHSLFNSISSDEFVLDMGLFPSSICNP